MFQLLFPVNPAIRAPVWANDIDIAKALVPIALIGAWYVETTANCEIAARIANYDYETAENNILRSLNFEDSPVYPVIGKPFNNYSEKKAVYHAAAPTNRQASRTSSRLFIMY